MLTLRFVDPFVQGSGLSGACPVDAGAARKDDDTWDPLPGRAGTPRPRGAETAQPGSQAPAALLHQSHRRRAQGLPVEKDVRAG